jgi:dTDP-4-dehydrorhamnose reductase
MKWMITGLGGTLAPHLARAATATGVEVVGWNRARVDPDDVVGGARFLAAEEPDAIAHLGMGSADWAGRLAAAAKAHGLPFVFTSTAMVFDSDPDGPHAIDAERNATDPYGQYKIACESAVLSAYPQASIARIGWQIDPQQPGNNMLMALDAWQANDGHVAASRAWTPACSFMQDTAVALMKLLERPTAGVVHLDSNADEAHSFDRIVAGLKLAFARDAWVLRVHEDYRHDQRLVGSAGLMPPLSASLPFLRG